MKVNINLIKEPLNNYKNDDLKLLEKLKVSITKFGQIKPLIVRQVSDKFEIIDGVNVYRALKQLNYSEVEIYNLGEIDETESINHRILLTRFEFDYDVIKLIDQMHNVMKKYTIEQLQEFYPYTSEQLENYKTLFDFDWSQYGIKKEPVKKVKKSKLF